MNTRVQDWGGRGVIKGLATTEELGILSGELFAGEKLEPEDVHVRRMLLCHDQYDRTYERFPKEMLQRFAQTLPGKSVLPNHDTGGWSGGGSLPLARFFAAGIQRRTEDEFPVLRRGRANGQRKPTATGSLDAPPPGFDLERVAVTYLRASFYFPNHDSTEGLLVHLDTGVYKWVSIGFRYDDIECDICKKSYLGGECRHYLGWPDAETGELCTGTYSGAMEFAEALEGSIVYLGGQQRARTIKTMIETGTVDPVKLAATPYGEDLVALKDAERLANEYGNLRKVFPAAKVAGESDGAPVGLSLSDEAQLVLASVGGLVERASSVRELREQSGKRLGTGTVETLRTLRTALDDLVQVSEEGKSETVGETAGQKPKDLKSAAAAELLLAEADAERLALGL